MRFFTNRKDRLIKENKMKQKNKKTRLDLNWAQLGKDCWSVIYNYLHWKDALSLRRCSRLLKEFISFATFWKKWSRAFDWVYFGEPTSFLELNQILIYHKKSTYSVPLNIRGAQDLPHQIGQTRNVCFQIFRQNGVQIVGFDKFTFERRFVKSSLYEDTHYQFLDYHLLTYDVDIEKLCIIDESGNSTLLAKEKSFRDFGNTICGRTTANDIGEPMSLKFVTSKSPTEYFIEERIFTFKNVGEIVYSTKDFVIRRTIMDGTSIHWSDLESTRLPFDISKIFTKLDETRYIYFRTYVNPLFFGPEGSWASILGILDVKDMKCSREILWKGRSVNPSNPTLIRVGNLLLFTPNDGSESLYRFSLEPLKLFSTTIFFTQKVVPIFLGYGLVDKNHSIDSEWYFLHPSSKIVFDRFVMPSKKHVL